MPLTVPVLTRDQYVFDFELHPGPFCTRDLPAATIAQQFVEKLQCQVYKMKPRACLTCYYPMIFSQIKPFVLSQTVHEIVTATGWASISQ